MNENDPITPPPELVDKWEEEWHHSHFKHGNVDLSPYLATRAAQWGADQELEACCEWMANVPDFYTGSEIDLRAARRPKPPSLKEQALGVFEALIHGDASGLDVGVIRRALKALPE